jgi:hypothetical protein
MKSDHHTSSWLFESQLAPFVDAFKLHLFDCRYASNTIDNYLSGLTHFAHWQVSCGASMLRHCSAFNPRGYERPTTYANCYFTP